MGRKILITAGEIKVLAELNDSQTAEMIWKSLPIRGRVNLWGDEIYFTITLRLDLENGREVVNNGDLGYWPEGPAFCIFFGPTPASCGKEIRPASAVSIFGKITGDTGILKKITGGTQITIDKAG